ncbi:hypothetical protein D3C73_1517780 [compost metagenome]
MQAGIVSAPMVIVVSITGIASYIIPRMELDLTFRLLRFVLLILGGQWVCLALSSLPSSFMGIWPTSGHSAHRTSSRLPRLFSETGKIRCCVHLICL